MANGLFDMNLLTNLTSGSTESKTETSKETAKKAEKAALDQGGLFGMIGNVVGTGGQIALAYNKDYQSTQRAMADAQAESARNENKTLSGNSWIWIVAILAIVITAIVLIAK